VLSGVEASKGFSVKDKIADNQFFINNFRMKKLFIILFFFSFLISESLFAWEGMPLPPLKVEGALSQRPPW
jgi:hypothetical protein